MGKEKLTSKEEHFINYSRKGCSSLVFSTIIVLIPTAILFGVMYLDYLQRPDDGRSIIIFALTVFWLSSAWALIAVNLLNRKWIKIIDKLM